MCKLYSQALLIYVAADSNNNGPSSMNMLNKCCILNIAWYVVNFHIKTHNTKTYSESFIKLSYIIHYITVTSYTYIHTLLLVYTSLTYELIPAKASTEGG